MDLLLKSANLTALLTTWHGALSQMNPTLNRFTFSQPPPQEFTRQQPKIFDRPRSQDNTPGRQFSLKLTTMTITVVRHFGKSEVNHKYIRNIERNEGTLKIRDTIRNKSEINSEVKIRNIIRNTSEMHHK